MINYPKEYFRHKTGGHVMGSFESIIFSKGGEEVEP